MYKYLLAVLLSVFVWAQTVVSEIVQTQANVPSASPNPSSSSLLETDSEATTMTSAQAAAFQRAYQREYARAQDLQNSLHAREQRFAEVLGEKDKVKFDNLRYVPSSCSWITPLYRAFSLALVSIVHFCKVTFSLYLYHHNFVMSMSLSLLSGLKLSLLLTWFISLIHASLSLSITLHSRAGSWLFREGRLEEGAALFTRAIDMYGQALAQPYNDVRSSLD